MEFSGGPRNILHRHSLNLVATMVDDDEVVHSFAELISTVFSRGERSGCNRELFNYEIHSLTHSPRAEVTKLCQFTKFFSQAKNRGLSV